MPADRRSLAASPGARLLGAAVLMLAVALTLAACGSGGGAASAARGTTGTTGVADTVGA
jgi:hypothetical protein